MSGSPGATVHAVLVTYRPDQAHLERLLAVLNGQVACVHLIENEADGLAALPSMTIPILRQTNARNLGLAAAQNQGIRSTLEQGASHVLLLDQDSLPEPDMVANLLAAEQVLRAEGLAVGAIGPWCIDRKDGQPLPFVRVDWRGIHRTRDPAGRRWMEADFLIASGCLVPVATFAAAGLMDEALFIDQVDVDWCYRVRAAGLRCYGVFDARLLHSLGDRVVPLVWGWRQQIVHGPVRLYYITRNRIWLYRRHYMPWAWRCHDAMRMIAKMLVFSLLVSPRRAHCAALWRALVDGLAGKVKRGPPASASGASSR